MLNEIVNKIDLSDVKIWSKKKKYYIPFETPQSLVLFPENSQKCKYCGFYESVCMCKDRKQKRYPSLNSIKEAFKQWIHKTLINYHSRQCSRLMKKSNKIDRKASKHYYIVKDMQESKINWKDVEFEGIEIKMSGGL